jgi:hypothetical protein
MPSKLPRRRHVTDCCFITIGEAGAAAGTTIVTVKAGRKSFERNIYRKSARELQ